MLRKSSVCVTRSVRRATTSLNCVRKFSDNRDDYKNIRDDMLQRSYEGLFPRLNTVFSLLDASTLDHFNKIKLDSVMLKEGGEDNLLRQLISYADLKNPLLLKYKFDIKDFMIGAKYGSEKAINILISSRLFDNLNREDYEDLVYLKGILHPILYHQKIKHLKKLKEMNSTVIEDVESMKMAIDKCAMISIRTEVVAEEESLVGIDNSFFSVSIKQVKIPLEKEEKVDVPTAGSEVGVKIEGEKSNLESAGPVVRSKADKSSNGAAAGNQQEEEEEDEVDEEDQLDAIDNLSLDYPIGSVVATVRIYANAIYNNITGEANAESVKKQTLFHSVTFRACISEHQETEWRIVELN